MNSENLVVLAALVASGALCFFAYAFCSFARSLLRDVRKIRQYHRTTLSLADKALELHSAIGNNFYPIAVKLGENIEHIASMTRSSEEV